MASGRQIKLPDLQLGTDKATALGTAIHNELVARGFTVGDDKVMAEYVLIMLINKKSPEQVDRELSDFIGPELWDASFVDWLFEEAVKENPGSSEPAEQPQTIVNEAPPVLQPIPTIGTDSRDRDGRRSGPPSRIYNQAVGGAQKRSASNRSPSPGTTPNKAARKSEAPSGPRAMRGDQQDGNRRSLKDRLGGFSREPNHPNQNQNQNQNQMGPRGPQFPNQGMPPMGQFGPDLQAMQGMNPNMAMTEMLVQQNALLQGLLHTMASGMQMGGMPGMMPGPPGPPGPFNGGMGPGFPDNGRGRGGSPTRGGRPHPGGERQGNHGPPMQSPVQGGAPPGIVQPTPVSVAASQLPPDLFDRPISPTLCKFGVKCSNALCRYSHPSAAASVESGVVLSTEPCPKGRRCDDKDCTLSHPSAGTNMNASMPQPRAPAAPPAPAPFGGVSSIPCKFGVNCTRPGCPYSHPTNQAAQSSVSCKFGIHCTRVDCKFSHPPGRVNPASFKGLSGASEAKSHANRSMRFNTGAAEFVPKQAGTAPNADGAAPGAEGQGDAAGTSSNAGNDSNPAEVIAAV